ARPLILGGVEIAHTRGPISHSDGDALLHAITDALLGALAQPDIGRLFPDNAPENESRDSAEFLAEAVKRTRATGYDIVNLDTTVILERPKLAPHIHAIRSRIAELLSVGTQSVNVKAKTHEKVDAIGENRAVETHAVVLLASVSAGQHPPGTPSA
ncbi:MAG: 2-C-methyl-D-erythritol 2,4-cyclodiphosphate synthase, partial [Planctomycetota bacterium]